MEEREVRELAAESEDVQARRDQLEEEIEILREGLEQCCKFRPRGITGKLEQDLPPYKLKQR
jgi:cell division protein FtsB